MFISMQKQKGKMQMRKMGQDKSGMQIDSYLNLSEPKRAKKSKNG